MHKVVCGPHSKFNQSHFKHKYKACTQHLPGRHWTTVVTEYALVSRGERRGEREANNELKAWLLGSNNPVLATTTISLNSSTITFFCLGTMCTTGMRVLVSAMRQKSPESVK